MGRAIAGDTSTGGPRGRSRKSSAHALTGPHGAQRVWDLIVESPIRPRGRSHSCDTIGPRSARRREADYPRCPRVTSAGWSRYSDGWGLTRCSSIASTAPPGWEDVENMVRAAELVDVTPIVRVQSDDPSTITRTLDRGAGGVQVPHINTRAQAEAAVRAAKFAPIGHRGYAGGRAALGVQGSFTSHANEETMVIAMLEEVEALKNLDAILTVEHIDAFFIAPGDLAQSMGYPGQPTIRRSRRPWRMPYAAPAPPSAPPACWPPAGRALAAISIWGPSSFTSRWQASSSPACGFPGGIQVSSTWDFDRGGAGLAVSRPGRVLGDRTGRDPSRRRETASFTMP